MRTLELRQLGLTPYQEAWDLQRALAESRKQGAIPDQLLLVEHPPVVTLGRNAHSSNILVSPERLTQLGIEQVEINRGGDVTFHGPGQIVGYPIVDLKDWKRDVVAYVRALEEVVIRVLRRHGLDPYRDSSATGVWVGDAKVCAIGVHISRWVTTHGFALNHTTDLSYYQYIVPCGLTRPVTSVERLGVAVSRPELESALADEFIQVFDYEPAPVRA